jgi:hypothetical protein
MALKLIKASVEIILVTLLACLFWMLGLNIGLYGMIRINNVYVTAQGSLWQILFAVIELSIGIWFFISIKRKTIPGRVNELVIGQLGQPILAAKVSYFPGVFSLGVCAGLVANAVIVFIQQAFYT